MLKKVKELKELKAMADELSAEISAIEDEIKAEWIAKMLMKWLLMYSKSDYKTVQSSRFDSKSFKATHSELYNQYCKATEYRRFSVA